MLGSVPSITPASELDNEMQQRCYQCLRPLSLCFCEAIPQIDNRTNVLILQHVGERRHPFNTARIVQKSLRRCHLISDHNPRLASHHLPIQAGAGLLYPLAGAPSLIELPAGELPGQLVIVDGTWHQAKTIVRDVPQLRGLPCYRLSPSSPGQYRIRREPNAHSLSTLEATVAALRTLEPNTAGLDQLLSAFNEMVESQLERSASQARWRQRKRRPTRHRFLPHALLENSNRLVVAYGEATPSRTGQDAATAMPVSWEAQRLGTAERFSCRLQPRQPLSADVLSHMRLSATDFDAALSHADFRQQWSGFLRDNDVLVVYHQRTYNLLRRIEAAQPRCLSLKSIFGKWRRGFRSLEELLQIEGVTPRVCDGNARAIQRLAMAVALVVHLRNR